MTEFKYLSCETNLLYKLLIIQVEKYFNTLCFSNCFNICLLYKYFQASDVVLSRIDVRRRRVICHTVSDSNENFV